MSKVYFADLNTNFGDDLLMKFDRLITRAGIDQIDFKDKIVAIKIHMGEWGNMAFLRQQYAKVLSDHLKNLGAKVFITDASTLYPGKRGNAVDHLECAAFNGYNQLTVGVPIIIADGLRGTDDKSIELDNATYCKAPKIASAIAEADIIISLTHAKGHVEAGFGGCLKNIGMGSGSKLGKMEMHSQATPSISKKDCIGCGNCVRHCANHGVNVVDGKAVIDEDKCLGCGYCFAYCPKGAINCKWDEAKDTLVCKIAEYAYAVIKDKPNFHISIATDIQAYCDCEASHRTSLVPDVGMFASFDPVALDQATVDAINKQPIMPHSLIEEHIHEENKDVFHLMHPDTDYAKGLDHAEKLGMGERDYDLIEVK